MDYPKKPQQSQCGWPSAPGVSQGRTRQSFSDLRGSEAWKEQVMDKKKKKSQ